MEDKIKCPKCSKLNDPHKFCIFCGNKLPVSDDELELMKENPEPTCLNCGRPVEKGQTRCQCGYEFSDINCPKCNKENPYTNRFCTSCGKKLWTSNVSQYQYNKHFFEKHLFKVRLPYSLRYTSLYKRVENDIGNDTLSDMSFLNLKNLKGIESEIDKTDNNLSEIYARWNVVSPNYCINCLEMINSNNSECERCRFPSGVKKRVEGIQTSDSYTEPVFDKPEFKWNAKNRELYLLSLAPSIGESQLEYRERLKWEYGANKIIMEELKKVKAKRIKVIRTVANASKRDGKTTYSKNEDDSFHGEWEVYGLPQDEWERQMFEDSKRRNEERTEF